MDNKAHLVKLELMEDIHQNQETSQLAGKTQEILTNDQICVLINKRVTMFRNSSEYVLFNHPSAIRDVAASESTTPPNKI